MRNKSAEKKVPNKTLLQYDAILSFMDDNTWHKSSDFIEVLDVKERRIQNLLRELVEGGQLVDDGSTKGKRYKKL